MSQKYHDPFEEDCYYHIYNRSVNNETIFLSERNYTYFLDQWKKYLSRELDVLSYCLLPNHYHFFVKVKENASNETLEDLFKRFLSSYSLAFNKENRRKGALFQKRFKRIKVENDDYITSIIHYIHNNPIHHGLTRAYEEWKYSSYNSIVSDKPTLIMKKEVLEWFGSKENFIEFHKQNVVFEKIKEWE